MGEMIAQPKRMKDKNGVDLRVIAHGSDERAEAAAAELKRRLGNLRGAVIPDWELAARGPDYLQWEVV